MKPAAFAYAKARSLDHAIELLGEHEGARVLAGGQSLIATLNMRLDAAEPAGRHQRDSAASTASRRRDGALRDRRPGAPRQAERSPVIAAHAPLIARAMPHIGHPAIRNRGTIGGSIALRRSGRRAAGLPAGPRRRGRDRRPAAAGAPLRPTISSATCSRPRSGRATCWPASACRPRGATPASASPSSPAATATTRWSGSPPARRGDRQGACATCGSPSSASARRRCARRRPRSRAGGASMATLDAAVAALGAAISIRPTTCRRPARRKKHLAGVLLRRVALQLAGGGRMSEHHARRYRTHGERRDGARERRGAQDAGRFPARRARPHRQPCRLRARRVRRLHGAARRRDRARLPDARGAVRRRNGRDHRRRVRLRRDRRPAGGLRAAQRAAVRLLHARHAAHRRRAARRAAACRAARRSARICRATTAAAPAIRRSSTRSRRWRSAARGSARHENRRRPAARPHRARPAELLYRPLGAAAEPRAPDAGARPVRQRRGAAAHGACGLSCARRTRMRASSAIDTDGGEARAGRDRRRHRRRARQGDDAVGRRAHPSQGHQVGAAIPDRGRARLLAGRGGLRRGGEDARAGGGRGRADRGRLRGAARGHRCGDRARCRDAGHPSGARRQSHLRAQARGRRGRQGLCGGRRGGRDDLRVRPPHRRDARAARHRGGLESRRAAPHRLPRARRRRT